MSAKRSIQLHEYRMAVIGIQNAVFMEPILKLRLRDELEQMVNTGKYIKQLEEERTQLLERIQQQEAENTKLRRYFNMLQAQFDKDHATTDDFLRQAEQAIRDTGCAECLGARFIFTQKTNCPQCNPYP